jgi:Beta-propeller repeat
MKQHAGKYFTLLTLLTLLAAISILAATQQEDASTTNPQGLAAIADAIHERQEEGDLVFVAKLDTETWRAFSWLASTRLVDTNFRAKVKQYPDARLWIVLAGKKEPDKGMVEALDTGYQAIDEIAAQDVRGRLYLPTSRLGNDTVTVHPRIRTDGPYRLDLSTYLGGNAGHSPNKWQQARDVAIDAAGNLYIVGGTSAADFPVTKGAFDTTFNVGGKHVGSFGYMDVFVTKLDVHGRLVWSTYLGGPNYDRAYAVEVDDEGYVYVAGTAGPGFPTTPDSLMPKPTSDPESLPPAVRAGYGDQDSFIAKLTPDGSKLVWATYAGVAVRDIAVDSEHNVHIAAVTGRADLPLITANAHQPERYGKGDTVYLKLSADGRKVLYGTYYGGVDDSKGDGGVPSVRVNRRDEAWLVSTTQATDIQVTENAFQKKPAGGRDLLVMKFSREGKLLVGTYLGGSGNESMETHDIAVDADDNVIVIGMTQSADFPVTPGAFQTEPGAGIARGNGFVAKLSSDGTRLLAATYIGGSGGDSAEGITVADNGDILISGGTGSEDFPVTGTAIQSQYGGRGDFFFARFDPDLEELRYSTFLGGTSKDEARSIAVAGNDIAMVGMTMSCNFPLMDPINNRIGGAWNAVAVRLHQQDSDSASAP